MKSKGIIFISIIGILILIFGLNIFTNKTKNPQKTETSDQKEQKKTEFTTKTNSEGEVTVEATPTRISPNENVRFNISLTTHSVDLNYSLKDISLMEDESGNIYNPISWSGGKGGHHLEGELIFPFISQESKSIKLTIKQIGGVERIFTWDL